MRTRSPDSVRQTLDTIYRVESRRIFATLVRLLGDFDLAEDALHDAFAAALEQWPREGTPAKPRAWLISAGRFKAIDGIRRKARFDAALPEIAEQYGSVHDGQFEIVGGEDVQDDTLRLIFTCCSPELSPEARVALTLREVCGLSTEEIARAFFIGAPTLAQRIVRAKAKIRDAKIPYLVPTLPDLPNRIDAVLSVIYLVFNEGYAATSGDSVTRTDLSKEAIRLARLLIALLPEPEVQGLLALMLLHESRRSARVSPNGDIVLLEDQDRRLWDRRLIDEGNELVSRALQSRRFGAYSIQAAISAVHANADNPAATDWAEIVGLYTVLYGITGSPVVELNRAVAVAMKDGPEAGLVIIDALSERGELKDYHLLHAAKAELCRRVGRYADARAAYELALKNVQMEPERRFLERKLSEVQQ